ncbi:hypothetical protein ABPH35_08775 [Streptococcus sp. ZJ93]|uniref:hypothetical protein n=1 Tax=Streptococcus handemini TaxID=3161188 RepID=UPI0032ECB804
MNTKKIVLASLASVSLLGAAVVAQQVVSPASNVEAASVAQLRVKVVDQKEAPVTGATVEVRIGGKPTTYTVDANGFVDITANAGDWVDYRIATLPAGYELDTYNGQSVSVQGTAQATDVHREERKLVVINKY